MKTIFVWGSGALLAIGGISALLPFPGSLVMVPLLILGWLVALQSRPRVAAPPPEVVRPDVEAPKERIVHVPVIPESLTPQLARLKVGVELADRLKTLVARQTEEATVLLTESLFEMAQKGQNMETQVGASLQLVADGESGLGQTSAKLQEQTSALETLSSHFVRVQDEQQADIRALMQTVQSINEFSRSLGDLADQTHVLAINASIEAARVGVHGRGFSVIAGHVQSLAGQSKMISERMAATVSDVVSRVSESFESQRRRIQEAHRLIHESKQGLTEWTARVGPQLKEVEEAIRQTHQLSRLISERLEALTPSLQFQDRIQQIADHGQSLLNHLMSSLEQGIPGELVPSEEDREMVHEAASARFTVAEEWSLIPPRWSRRPSGQSVEVF